jgi:hypothetical protein
MTSTPKAGDPSPAATEEQSYTERFRGTQWETRAPAAPELVVPRRSKLDSARLVARATWSIPGRSRPGRA